MIQHIENKSIILFPKPCKILELTKFSGGWHTLELNFFTQDNASSHRNETIKNFIKDSGKKIIY